MTSPLACRYNGDGFDVLPRFRKQADEQYVVGQVYILDPIDEHQSGRDKAFHASFREIWKNLPENSPYAKLKCDDFRRFCLIKTDFYVETIVTMQTEKDAKSIVPVMQDCGEFCIVNVTDAVVTRWKAKSQKIRGPMDKEERKESYRAVLDFASALIKSTPEEVERNAGNSA